MKAEAPRNPYEKKLFFGNSSRHDRHTLSDKQHYSLLPDTAHRHARAKSFKRHGWPGPGWSFGDLAGDGDSARRRSEYRGRMRRWRELRSLHAHGGWHSSWLGRSKGAGSIDVGE